jgi:hypothetical protein
VIPEATQSSSNFTPTRVKARFSLSMELTLGARLKQLHAPLLITWHTGFKGTWLTLLLEQLEIPTIGLSLPPLPESLYLRCGTAVGSVDSMTCPTVSN